MIWTILEASAVPSAPGHLAHVGPAQGQGPSAKIHVGAFGQNTHRDLRPLGMNRGFAENLVNFAETLPRAALCLDTSAQFVRFPLVSITLC